MDRNQWRQALTDADDDYLAGLCNKGTVKRAYKELDESQAEISQQAEGFRVQVGGESCQICLPLGDSRCSCVSRSICKHIIIAILKLRTYMESLGEEPSEEQAAEQEQNGEKETVVSEPETTEEDGRNFPEVSGFPLEKAKKVMGGRRYQRMVSSVSLNLRPQIEITSVITVTFPDGETKVKLLEPLEYASCSCHKKELCSHKAEAILWYQLEQGILTPEQLRGSEEAETGIDLDAVHGLADTILQLLETALSTGLARTSPDILDSLERMALLCHNQELADFERYSRSLRDSWQQYFNRMAVFRAEDLMTQLMMFYRRTQELRAAQSVALVRQLAGQFRSEYQLAGELTLIGIGSRYFLSKTGYEGETCYFLEASTGKWYTYTNARPVFYEQNSRRRPVVYGKMTPWDLKADFQEMTRLRIRLRKARVNGKNRLSSSKETQGEILGAREIKQSEIAKCYYDDFRKLFEERILAGPVLWMPEEEKEYGFDESRHPVLVQASACGQGEFDRIAQTFRMEIQDAQGVPLIIEVVYSKEEDFTIRYLERIARRIHSNHRSIPCFVGDVYLDDGRMKLYPITFLEPEEIIKDETTGSGASRLEAGESETESKKLEINGLAAKETSEANVRASSSAKMWPEEGGTESERTAETTEMIKTIGIIKEFIDQITGLLADLFQSGFLTVHDSTLRELDSAVPRAEQYGMKTLSVMLAELGEELRRQRHQMRSRDRKIFDFYGKINRYVFLCTKRLEMDRASVRLYTEGGKKYAESK